MTASKRKGLIARSGPGEAEALPEHLAKLTPLQQRFVIAYVERADSNRTAAARDAGVAAKTEASMNSRAYALFNHPDVRAAILEESRARLLACAPQAISLLQEIALNPAHKKQYAALVALLDRGGLGPRQIVDVNVKHDLTNIEKWQALIRGKMALGQDPRPLLVNLTGPERAQVLQGIDVEFEEVRDGD